MCAPFASPNSGRTAPYGTVQKADAEYRQRAVAARAQAERTADKSAKQAQLDIAQSWDLMAEEREGRAGHPST